MSVAEGTKRRRHVPVKGASHIYWSETTKGRVYEVRHPRNADKQRLFEVVGTRLDQAKARAREVHGDAAPRVVSVGLTLREVVEDWQRTRRVKPRTAESMDANLRVHVLPPLGRKKVREIDSGVVLQWLAGLKRKDGKPGELASGTQRLLLTTLSLVLQHAVDMGVLSAVPRVRRKPAPGAPSKRILSQDEERNLLAYTAPFPWLAPIVTVALHQALRLGEVLGLQWDDVDFVGGRLHVRHSLGRDGRTLGTPKGGRAATIPLTPIARQALLDLRLDGGTGFVFKNTLGGAFLLRNVQRAFDTAKVRAGLEGGVTFHALRHTAISRLANHPGVPISQVKEFARHSNIATTMGYVHHIESESVNTAIAEALAA